MIKTILITGGAGFIGSALTRALLKRKFRIICIDNFDNYYPKKFKLQNINDFRNHKNYKIYDVDIKEEGQLKKIVNKHAPYFSIIHLAARAGVRSSLNNPLLYQKINILGTYNLLTCSINNTRQLIFASSSSVYGDTNTPFNEDGSRLNPLSIYGATKLAGETACFAFHKNFNIPITILRFFSVYGPGGRPDMAPYLFAKALFENKTIDQFGDGTSRRDWTYIDDIINGVESSIKKIFPFQIINLGSNHPVSLLQLINKIEKISKKKFKIRIKLNRKDEPKTTFADITKARKLLNWKSETSFNTGLKKFISWYIRNRTGY